MTSDENDATEKTLFQDKVVTPFLSEAHQPHYHRSFALQNHSAVLAQICNINLT